MSDWEQFLAHVPYLIDDEPVSVGEPYPWDRGALAELPQLSRLLSGAVITPVGIGDRSLELIAWGSETARRGWLCEPPLASDQIAVAPVHQVFWTVCGGIVERFAEPESWWVNQNEVLTVTAARLPLARIMDDYSWMWTEHDLTMPITAEDFYVVAVEANGNLSIVDRVSGSLLLFAPDHSFAGVTTYRGCPPYSLLKIDDLPDLTSWIEDGARRHLRTVVW